MADEDNTTSPELKEHQIASQNWIGRIQIRRDIEPRGFRERLNRMRFVLGREVGPDYHRTDEGRQPMISVLELRTLLNTLDVLLGPVKDTFSKQEELDEALSRAGNLVSEYRYEIEELTGVPQTSAAEVLDSIGKFWAGQRRDKAGETLVEPSDAPPTQPVPRRRPHGESCGPLSHPHGPRCADDCPTCGGSV